MFFKIKQVLLTVVLMSFVKNYAQDKFFQDSLINVISSEMFNKNIPGVVLSIVKDDAVIISQGIGYANLKDKAEVDNNSLFRIGSISKLITCLGILSLIDEGKLNLEDNLSEKLPSEIFENRYQSQVKVKHLLNHTAGFDQIGIGRRQLDSLGRKTIGEFLIENLRQVREPGIAGVYDTYGITLAGFLIEKVTNQPYKSYMEHVLFPKFGLSNIYVEVPINKRKDLIQGYGFSNGKLIPQQYEYYVTTPASSIDMSNDDMGKLLLILSSKKEFEKVLSSLKYEELFTSMQPKHAEVNQFVNGFWESKYGSHKIYEHGGVLNGYECKLVIAPDINLGIFIGYNRDLETGPATNLRDIVSNFILNHYYKDDRKIKNPSTIDLDLHDYEGEYVSNLGCFSCLVGSGWSIYTRRLFIDSDGKMNFLGKTWLPVKVDVFKRADNNDYIQFKTDSNGNTFLLYNNNSYTKASKNLLQDMLEDGWKNRQRTRIQEILEDYGLYKTNELKKPNSGIRYKRIHNLTFNLNRASTGGISCIDFDNDGDEDLFVTNGYDVSSDMPVPQTNWLYENNNGTFTQLKNNLSDHEGFSSGSAWADFDNDGDLDVFVPNQRNQNNFLYTNNNGVFDLVKESPVVTDGGLSFASTWADIDNDGWVDLYVSNGGFSGKQKDFMYRNLNGEKFEKINNIITKDSLQSGGATFVDYDNDGDLDLYIPGEKIRMYDNYGDFDFRLNTSLSFTSEDPPGFSLSGAWGDYDNDGDLDLVQVFTGGTRNRAYENKGDGTFELADLGDLSEDVSSSFHGLWIDFDNDGYQDFLTANWGTRPLIYKNYGGSKFERVELSIFNEIKWHASMAAALDFDKDGDMDIVVGNWPGNSGEYEENLFYVNESKLTNNFIDITLIGSTSNKSAIGAKIKITSKEEKNSTEIIREIRSQDGWRGQSPLKQTIGLGPLKEIDVKIYWPSGKTTILASQNVNRNLTIHE